ncbi:MAG: hypothetical protein LKI59_03975 [Bacteroidales bacterium]|jgi:hypothetical protein|nr:hypothetical protein [Bacteroidales bacterium]
MRKIISISFSLFVAIIFSWTQALAGNPGGKCKTSFGIFVDSATYSECKQELDAYRNVLIKEGLYAKLLASDWTSPEQVKAKITELAADKKYPLEGVVFVGDIPIVMVRQAQWMTTAFKMNESTFPIFDSSVASDRYYDDFDLRFDFIQKDTAVHNIFYYRLSEKGSQHLHPDIYSARMKVPGIMISKGGNRYAIMRAYLRKVVAAHKEKNTFDKLEFFFGSGYNSEDMNVWRQKASEYKEYFPYAYRKASGNRFLDFHENNQMKWNLFTELQRPDVDLFQFTEHGDYDIQFINGTQEGKDLEDNLYYLKDVTARQYKRWKGTKDDEPFKHEVLDSVFHLDRKSVSDSAMAYYHRTDSIETRNANIYQEDLLNVRSNPKVVILNACYNGSFHNPEGYIAGVHVFGPGKCIVAQGNTVNALQDKWEDKLIGYLSVGLRIGFWEKEVPYLENHLIGDPTFRFSPHDNKEASFCGKLHDDLVKDPDNAAVWKKYLKSDKAIARAAGIIHLGYASTENGFDVSNTALSMLRNDPSCIVRMSAFSVLATLADDNAQAAILTAVNDPYEYIVRSACIFAGSYGTAGKDSVIFRAMEKLHNDNPELARVNWISGSAMDIIKGEEYFDQELAVIKDTSKTEKRRINAMRLFRNNRYIKAIPVLLDAATDDSASEDSRTVAWEVLGWYNQSAAREQIIYKINMILHTNANLPENVAKEMFKTLKRLENN